MNKSGWRRANAEETVFSLVVEGERAGARAGGVGLIV